MEHEMIPTVHAHAQLPDTGWIDVSDAVAATIGQPIDANVCTVRRVAHEVTFRIAIPWLGAVNPRPVFPSSKSQDAVIWKPKSGFSLDAPRVPFRTGYPVSAPLHAVQSGEIVQDRRLVYMFDTGDARYQGVAISGTGTASLFSGTLTFPTSDPWPKQHPPVN
ncbi:MAG: hypothetical protein E7L06_08500 [Schaalia turicensis]|nr:hypothetical protein [Schaalia turicensis]